MKRVAIYVRVSTQEQATEGYSISEQTDRLNKYSEAHGWTIVKTYTDPGFSGSSLDRPAMKELINDCKNSVFDLVLVYKLDRLSRSQKDTLHLIEDIFIKNNIDFISMNENFDTSTPFGRAMIGILSVFAQLEREQIKERMKMGHVGRAKKGLWHGGSIPPIGYDYIDGMLIVNEYEALQIRKIYELFLNGLDGREMSMREIGLHMQKHYTNRYSSWNKLAAIGLILKNPLYTGKLTYLGEVIDGAHEAIISQDIFDKAQNKYETYIKKFGLSQRTPFEGKNLLSGLVFCGKCGARYFIITTNNKRKNGKVDVYNYYKCYSRDGRTKMKKTDNCDAPLWRKEKLNDLIISEILKLSDSPEEIKRLIKSAPQEIDESERVIRKRIDEIAKQEEKLIQLFQIGNINIEVITKRTHDLALEKEKLAAELESMESPQPRITETEALSIIQDSKSVLLEGTPQQKQAVVRMLIDKIIIYDDRFEIHWAFNA